MTMQRWAWKSWRFLFFLGNERCAERHAHRVVFFGIPKPGTGDLAFAVWSASENQWVSTQLVTCLISQLKPVSIHMCIFSQPYRTQTQMLWLSPQVTCRVSFMSSYLSTWAPFSQVPIISCMNSLDRVFALIQTASISSFKCLLWIKSLS